MRLHAGPTNNGGDAQVWFAETFGIALEELSTQVSDRPYSECTPLFLPQLDGERAPMWNSDLRAAFLGVSRKTELGDFARSVQTGVALAARHVFETLKTSAGVSPDWIAGGGGGFRSRSWNQIRADVFGIPIKRLVAEQPGGLGAAMIAGLGISRFDTLEAAVETLLQFGTVYQPDDKATRQYDELFEVYKNAISTQSAITDRLLEVSRH